MKADEVDGIQYDSLRDFYVVFGYRISAEFLAQTDAWDLVLRSRDVHDFKRRVMEMADRQSEMYGVRIEAEFTKGPDDTPEVRLRERNDILDG